MLQGPGSPSAARRTLAALARIGVDLRPLLRRARDALLRPVRHQLATQGTAVREQIDARIGEIAARIEAQEGSRQALAAHVAEISARIEAEAAERQALAAHLVEIGVRVEAERGERRTRLALLESLITEVDPPASLAVAQGIRDIPSPVVSIILPTRDRARFVCDAIASVQAQHFTDWELIIIDDGSEDDTASAVAPYLADARIRYLARPAQGVSAARNDGLKLARGALIAYLDSDNVWYPDFLTVAVNALLADPKLNLVYGVLVTDSHALDGTRLLWMPFDRERLLSSNYIDMNVVVHRRTMIERYGDFDVELARLTDWDLILRYTEHVPARRLPVLAARYRVCDDQRVTATRPLGPELFAIKRKWYPPASSGRRPRVLYVVWQYPQLSETYIEDEIRCMLRLGAHVEVWHEMQPATPHPTSVPIHDGPLADVVRRVRPDVVHVHWLGFATKRAALLAQLGVPVTVRLHGFDTSAEACRAILDQPWILAVHCFPHHLDLIGRSDPRLRAVPAAFDTTLFRPSASKDRRLVLRAGSALPSKDPALFFELANRLPDYRFVLAAVTCTLEERYAEAYRDLHRQMNSRCELMFDIQHEDLVPLMERAGIYLHTAKPPGTEHGTPIGMPVSIAEAMATGAYVLVRDLPELSGYVGDAGATYRDVEHAAEIIASTAEWPEQRWKQAWIASVDRAFSIHADEMALRPIFEDWCSAAAPCGRRA
ncbi:MAG TPA: glycosyltransferase [Xanthobacteraceae bacterium]|nr:glycosyltransferase [Xanthobacteraceae bacterium]